MWSLSREYRWPVNEKNSRGVQKESDRRSIEPFTLIAGGRHVFPSPHRNVYHRLRCVLCCSSLCAASRCSLSCLSYHISPPKTRAICSIALIASTETCSDAAQSAQSVRAERNSRREKGRKLESVRDWRSEREDEGEDVEDVEFGWVEDEAAVAEANGE